MIKAIMLSVIKRLALFTLIMSVVSCSESIDNGELLGLKIGQSKGQVIGDLRSNAHVTHIKPDIAESFEIKSSSKNKDQLISTLIDQPGIVIVGKSPKLYIKISFESSLVKDVYLAPVNKGEALGLSVGMDKKDVKRLLLKHLSSNKINHIFNFMPNASWIEIANMNKEDYLRLLSHDAWAFNETNKYSSVKLHFTEGILTSIDYNWTPIELP